MATKTTNYNLTKPAPEDPALIGDINDNMDTIDSLIYQLANAGADEEVLQLLRQIKAAIGNASDADLQTLFAKLNELLKRVGASADTGSLNNGSNSGRINALLEETATAMSKIEQNITLTTGVNSKVDSCNENLKTVIKMLSFGQWEQSTPGVYNLQLPESVNFIIVSACGGGGGGGGGFMARPGQTSNTVGGAGGGASAVENKKITVPPGKNLNITIGDGGKGSKSNDGENGYPTIIADLLTLAGGKGGKSAKNGATGGAAGGTGGGNGANGGDDGPFQNGGNGIKPGGRATNKSPGGGGSLGEGGSASTETVGHGGGGYGLWGVGASSEQTAQNGGCGYVKITWGDE